MAPIYANSSENSIEITRNNNQNYQSEDTDRKIRRKSKDPFKLVRKDSKRKSPLKIPENLLFGLQITS